MFKKIKKFNTFSERVEKMAIFGYEKCTVLTVAAKKTKKWLNLRFSL